MVQAVLDLARIFEGKVANIVTLQKLLGLKQAKLLFDDRSVDENVNINRNLVEDSSDLLVQDKQALFLGEVLSILQKNIAESDINEKHVSVSDDRGAVVFLVATACNIIVDDEVSLLEVLELHMEVGNQPLRSYDFILTLEQRIHQILFLWVWVSKQDDFHSYKSYLRIFNFLSVII